MNTHTALYLIGGTVLAAVLVQYARRLRPNAEKRFLALALLVAAAFYAMFALVAGEGEWLVIELAGVALYGLFAWLAFTHSSYWLALGWLTHPAWDVFLHVLGPGNQFAPEWYAVACVSFDIVVAAYVASRVGNWRGA